jgi:hypothetical protein
MDVWVDFGEPILDAQWEQLLAKTQDVINAKIVDFQEIIAKNETNTEGV